MSYRTFKRVLGETSLERKCRFLFGTSLFFLIFGGFWWYSQKINGLYAETVRSNCRFLVETVWLKLHWSVDTEDSKFAPLVEEQIEGSGDLTYDGKYLTLTNVDQPEEHPHLEQVTDPDEVALVRQLQKRHREQQARLSSAERTEPPPDDLADAEPKEIYETYLDSNWRNVEADRIDDSGHFLFYRTIRWKRECVTCHMTNYGIEPQGSYEENIAQMPVPVVRIAVPYGNTQNAQTKSFSILMATAIITVFLSMIALYIVVRYVIVKPLQHLQNVSEEIEHGNYTARAQIETNDEFEDLAQSFNRMLRHLVQTQQQLRDANTNLDGKVDQLAQANMQLYEMNQVKSDFLANVSHELRTPLNSIIGFSDVLQGIDALNQKQKKYATNIGQSGRVLRNMINDILDLAKLESGKSTVRPTDFALDAVVSSQCDTVRALAEEKNIDLQVACEDGVGVVYQDQSKIQQILTNLLSNAIKFTPEGGRIRVRVVEDKSPLKDDIVLTVEDTGVGIAEEDRESIFEKFRQGTVTRGSDNLVREFSGTGLGLSIVRELARLLGGAISFDSELGHGSTFRVTLPRRIATHDAQQDTGPLRASEWQESNAPAKPMGTAPAGPDG
ncbi:MAG: HAMP domain-containing sensor histidine kinase [Planctomycetota bacterium]